MGQSNNNSEAFLKLDSIKYAGKCVGMIDGKIKIVGTDPNEVYERLLNISDKDIGIFCFPSTKQTMAI
jgi:hypothetical protein